MYVCLCIKVYWIYYESLSVENDALPQNQRGGESGQYKVYTSLAERVVHMFEGEAPRLTWENQVKYETLGE